MSEKEAINWLTLITKVTAITTIITAIFGVGYQKGMIIQMGVGNLSGNYELREIFNSSILGYLHIFDSVVNVGSENLLISIKIIALIVLSVFTAIGFVYAFICDFEKGKVTGKTKKTQKRLRRRIKLLRGKPLSYLVYSLLGTLVGTVATIAIIFTSYLAVILSASIITFPLMGYYAGAGKIKSELKEPVCVATKEDILQYNYIYQCTQVLINGKRIAGEVLLENQEGYFIKRNSAFVFISKDGKNCVFRKYYSKTRDKYKKLEDIDFENLDSDLDSFCDGRKAK